MGLEAMGSEPPSELEQRIRERHEAGDLTGAATLGIKSYGPDLFGFLLAFHRDEVAASEAFSEVTERIWKGLPGFAWRSSFRTWAYSVTRRVAVSYQRDVRRRHRRFEGLPEGSALSAIAEAVRSATLSHLKTETRTRAVELRESLPRADQELLVLRIDKGLSWPELAQVLNESETQLEGAALRREAARLRKRFQLARQKLLELARREGLVGPRPAD